MVLGAVEALLESIGVVLDRERPRAIRACCSRRPRQVGDEEFEQAWTEGRAMSMEQAIEYALQEDNSECA